MIKIGHDDLKKYMLQFPVKSEEQMLNMINFFIQQAINEYLKEDLGLAPDEDS